MRECVRDRWEHDRERRKTVTMRSGNRDWFGVAENVFLYFYVFYGSFPVYRMQAEMVIFDVQHSVSRLASKWVFSVYRL